MQTSSDPPAGAERQPERAPPESGRGARVSAYAVAMLLMVTAFGFRYLLDPLFGNLYPITPFTFAVALSAWCGGWKPGVLSLVLSLALASYFFMHPRGSFAIEGPEQQVGAVVYLLTAGGSIVLIGLLRIQIRKVDSITAGLAEEIRDRKRIAEELRATQAFTQGVLDSLGAHIAVLDPAGVIVAQNAAWDRFARANGGTQPRCGLGVNYLDVCRRATGACAEESHLVAHGVASVLDKSAHAFTLEYPCHSPADERWFVVSVTPLADGRPGAVVSHHDVTDRKQAQRESQRTREQLINAIESLDAGFVMYDADERLAVCNTRYKELYPVCAHTMVRGAKYEDVLRAFTANGGHRASGLTADQWIAARLLAHRSVVDTTEQRLADQWVRISDRRTRDGGVVSLRTDITALKEAQEAAEAATRAKGELLTRINAVIEAAVDGIISTTADGTIDSANPAAERLFGYVAAEMIGRNVSALMPAPFAARHNGHLANYLQTGEQKVTRADPEVRGLRKNGSTFPVELAVSEMFVAGQRMFTGIVRDVTDRQVAERELRSAKEAAEAASRAKSDFLANMSHEFRTPMAAIVGYAEMLLDPRLHTDERVVAVQAIARNGRHMVALISNVLDLTKIENGRVEIETLSCGVLRMVNEALSAAGAVARAKALDLQLTPLGRLPRTITTDPTRFRQVLDNLLSNAVKFTAAGKRIDLRLRLDQRPGGARLVLEIEDQGAGIDPAALPRLFQPFTQADASTTRKYGGTGLGLSICKRLTELLGGEIGVRSTPGVGTCFTVSLPLAPADLTDLLDVAAFVVESGPLAAAPLAPVERLSGRVLVADDNPDNLSILRYFLERAGLTVETAENGRVAVNRASAEEFDMVFMDMQMPELDGYAATSTLRQRGFGRAIVALTAHALTGDEERCLQAGCNAYLTKPVDPGVLIKMVVRQMPSRSWVTPRTETVRVAPAAPAPAVPSGLTELTRKYRLSLPDKARDLAAALRTDDRGALSGLAHKLKGSAGMYGLPNVSDLAEALDDAIQNGQPAATLAGFVAHLSEECARAAHETERR